jgi:predicted acetyltransferase
MSTEHMPPQRVEVLSAARDQEPVLANLLELYAYDLSEPADLYLAPDGRYGYESLSLYWNDESRLPFLVKVDGCLGGFALISRGSLISGDCSVWDMAEFFVLRRYRRRGVGATVAQEIWRRFRGPWEVRVLEANTPAQMFWQRTISAFTGVLAEPIRVEQGGKQRLLFAFDCSDSVR